MRLAWHIAASVFVFCLSARLGAQDILLLSEDFETGGFSFTLNSGDLGTNTGDNQWIITNEYSGAPTYPNTTTQDNTNGGTIGFAPTSHYLHIHDAPSGITNANYNPASPSDRFAHTTFGLCTYGMEDVHFSFFYLCEGSASAYGSIYYSVDGGPWTQIGQAQYTNMTNWQYVDITDPAFENVGSLRFGFRWQDNTAGPPYSLPFAIDDINIVATYSVMDPVTVTVTNVYPSPVCQGGFLTIEFALSDTLCDGNYQIELSNSQGNFPSPFGTWVFPINYPQTTGAVSILLPGGAQPGDCYRIRINRLSPLPVIQGIASVCFEIIECPNVITTLQPVVTIDTNAVCIGSAIDIPFTSTGIYTNNTYIAQLSDPDGTFPPNPEVVGSSQDSNTYDPMLGQMPGSVGGQVPNVEPGCNYYIRIISTNPDAIGSPWGPFCIQECDISTNNFEDLQFCVNECGVDPDGENDIIDIDVNTYDNVAQYLPGNLFTTQLLSSMSFGQIGPDGLLGSVAATDDTTLPIHIPCKDSLPIYGIPLGMNYFRVIATNSTAPENSLGSLIRLTIGAYRNTPQIITSYEYPLGLPRDVFCVGETVRLSFEPYNYFDNSTFMWTCNAINGGNPFVSPQGANSNSLYVILGGPGTLVFSVQETNNGCVSPWIPADTVIVLGDPVANITGPTLVCEGDTNHYQVPFYPNTYYSWDTSADPGDIAYQDTSNNEMNISFSETGMYTLSINVLNLCGSDSDTHTVQVIGGPNVDAEPDTTICINQSVVLSTPPSPGYSYSWSDGQSTIGNTSSIEVSPEVTTSYIATVTGNGGCQSRDTAEVIVLLPDPAIVYQDSLCPGGLNQIELEADTLGTYLWSTGSDNASILVNDTGTYALSIGIVGQICPRLVEFEVNPMEPDLAEQFTDSICPGGQNDLLLSATQPGTYLWSTGSISAAITVHDIGTYTLGIYDPDERCPDLYEYLVVPMEPDPAIALLDSVCPHGLYPIELNADANGSYLWSTGSLSPSIHVNDTGIYILNIYIPDEPCPRILEFTVIPDSCIAKPDLFVYVPNAFTPNSDGVNDVFGPEFSDLSLVLEYKFQIFNRWGEMVFESINPVERWPGNFRKGDYFVKDEVYVYQLSYRQLHTPDRIELAGHVTMLR